MPRLEKVGDGVVAAVADGCGITQVDRDLYDWVDQTAYRSHSLTLVDYSSCASASTESTASATNRYTYDKWLSTSMAASHLDSPPFSGM